jgi:hypothetical protein
LSSPNWAQPLPRPVTSFRRPGRPTASSAPALLATGSRLGRRREPAAGALLTCVKGGSLARAYDARMRIALLIIAALLSPLTTAAAEPLENSVKGIDLLRLAMQTAMFLAYDEHCEPLPPALKAVIVDTMRQLNAKNQQTIADLQVAMARGSTDVLCQSARVEVRKLIEQAEKAGHL